MNAEKMFRDQTLTCKNCGRVQKMYPYFESQWTSVSMDDAEMMFFCPKCWGIPDPAPGFCRQRGHDYEGGKCQRCGKVQVSK